MSSARQGSTWCTSPEPAHKRRQGDDLIAARELRLLQQIDDLDTVPSREMLFAHLFEIAQRGRAPRRVARDIEPENPSLRATLAAAGAHTATVPRSVSSNSRASDECGMPRDFRIER